MFKTSCFFIILLLFQQIILSTSLPNREAIIMLDTHNLEFAEQSLNENFNYTKPMGIGAISNALLFALYQKAAPIITNRSLMKNIIDHQNIFYDFVHCDTTTLYKKYGHYKKFNDQKALKIFEANCKYIHQSTAAINQFLATSLKNDDLDQLYQILDQIETNKKFNLDSAPDIIKTSNQETQATRDLQLEIIIYLLCSWIDLENDWDINQVNDDIFLLIPKNYINNLSLHVPNTAIKPNNKTTYTNLELSLGLKIDHMKRVNRSFFEQSIKQTTHTTFKKSLEQIFITQDDLTKYGSNNGKHTWSFFMTGHGLPPSKEIQALPQLYKLLDISKKKLKSPVFKSCLAYEKNKQHTKKRDAHHIRTCQHHAKCLEYITNVKKLNKEIKRCERLSASHHNQSMILSLSIEEFKELLKFFNNDIDTSLFYYQSCFGGGNHLDKPYEEHGKALIFNYHIISSTPTDNVTFNEFPIINIPPYAKNGKAISFWPSQIHHDDIDLINKKLKVDATLHFDRFFAALREGILNNKEQLLLVCYALHPHVDEHGTIINNRIASIPLIRLANTDHFQPIPYDTSSKILDESNHGNPIVVDTDAALISGKYIPRKVILNKLNNPTTLPQLFSIKPGFALHIFEDLSSTTCNLHEIINSFLPFPELSSSKVFWIKKLACKNDQNTMETFKDVIIMRNILNSHELLQASHKQSVNLENCVYFSTKNNQESKLTWEGPFIDHHNWKAVLCKQSYHKDECLNNFPDSEKFLKPLIQTI